MKNVNEIPDYTEEIQTLRNENIELKTKNDALETKNASLETKNAELAALIKFYEELIQLEKHRQFGSSSEKSENYEQLGLFDEPENTADKKEPEPTIEKITYTRKKRIGKREEDLSKLPVETISYELPEEERVCPECGESLHVMSKEVRREIKIVPAQYIVVEHVQNIYACRSCAKENDHVPVIKAKAPEPVIKGSLASWSLVAHIMTEKYVKAVPLYRQEQSLFREGISISRQNMANWILRASFDWLQPIYNRLKECLLNESVLHADETVLQVLKEPNKKAKTNSYEWLYRTSGCSEHPIVLYEYQPTRSSSHPKRFLEGWSGYLHTDGYDGYHRLPDVTVVGCFAHVRRKFDEAQKVLPVDQRANSSAAVGLNYCNRLFELERSFKGFSPEVRFQKRLELSLPIAEEFLEWAKSFLNHQKSLTQKAAFYLVNQWPYLKNFWSDGRLELSNNRAERSIKPFVIGRKNWLFSNTVNGAEASSIIYSIIQTALENNLKPYDYLALLLKTMPNCSMSEINNLLPWSDQVRVHCGLPLL